METGFNRILGQIREFLRTLSWAKMAALVGVLSAIVAVCAVTFGWLGDKNYVPLMTNLSPDDATNIMRILREKHIAFITDPTGKIISIPSQSVYDFRLELATMGLPQNSVVGYELFDKQSLGTTSFVQKLNQKRAQEGELMRTINTIRGVKRSRVHLALPQKSTFIEDQRKPSASVVLDLDLGVQLSDKQVLGIGTMVARGVEGLEPNDVIIMNSDGKVLSTNRSDPLAAATATQLEYQEKVQSDLERRIEAMLGRIVGEGKVAATVNADLDFMQVNETQTLYDNDSAAVVSVEKHNDSMNGTRPGAFGGAGSQSNTPGQTASGQGDVKTQTNKNNEVTNYKVPETIRRTTKSLGAIKRLSVAIVLDAKRLKVKDKDQKVITKVEDWTAEQMKEFEKIASSAVGLDKVRGDTLEIKSLEFQQVDFEDAERVVLEREQKSYLEKVMLYAVILVTLALFFLVVVKPFIRWLTDNTSESVDTFLPQTIEELERLQKSSILPNFEENIPVIPDSLDPVKVEGEMIKEKIVSLIDSNPHKAAFIVKDWLLSDSAKRSASDAREEPEGKAGQKPTQRQAQA